MVSIRRLGRVQPITDTTERMPVGNLVSLVLVETLGIAIIIGSSRLLAGELDFIHTLLIAPIVTFVLIVAQPQLPGSRPFRVLAAYASAGIIGIGLAAFTWPITIRGIIAAAVTLFVMYLLGIFHAPACAVPFAALLLSFELLDAPRAYLILMTYTALVVVLAIMANRLLGYRSYPERWW